MEPEIVGDKRMKETTYPVVSSVNAEMVWGVSEYIASEISQGPEYLEDCEGEVARSWSQLLDAFRD